MTFDEMKGLVKDAKERRIKAFEKGEESYPKVNTLVLQNDDLSYERLKTVRGSVLTSTYQNNQRETATTNLTITPPTNRYMHRSLTTPIMVVKQEDNYKIIPVFTLVNDVKQNKHQFCQICVNCGISWI